MQILILANNIVIFRLIQERFKLKDKDELRVNLKHLAYYTLAWIVYIDNMCNMHRIPKDKYYRYLIRIYWTTDEKRYRNAKYIYS